MAVEKKIVENIKWFMKGNCFTVQDRRASGQKKCAHVGGGRRYNGQKRVEREKLII